MIRDDFGWMVQGGGIGNMMASSALMMKDGLNMMANSAFMMKDEAIRKTLKVCSKSGYGKIEIESDSLQVVQMLSG